MERTAQCHCGALRVVATGEPERVYLCHCRACQRRTGTAFHFGATYLKDRVRLDGDRKVYERGADSGNRIRPPGVRLMPVVAKNRGKARHWHFCKIG